MNTITPINLKPISFFRSVTHSAGNEARRLTLPIKWVKFHAYPQQVFVITGNILIVASENNRDLAIEAAGCLYQNGLMQPIDKQPMGEAEVEIIHAAQTPSNESLL